MAEPTLWVAVQNTLKFTGLQPRKKPDFHTYARRTPSLLHPYSKQELPQDVRKSQALSAAYRRVLLGDAQMRWSHTGQKSRKLPK